MGERRGPFLVVIGAIGALGVLFLLLWAVSTRAIGGSGTGEEVDTPAVSVAWESPSATLQEDSYTEERERMVSYQIAARGVRDSEVLEAVQAVPRHEFVLQEYLDLSYSDRPLPIGYGQTISQPYIVAVMTELLELEKGDKVLEIGTGSGYQGAVLAEVVDQVYTVEIIPELAASARERLDRLGYGYVETLNADGYHGWEEHAPYDAIIVTAAPDHMPQPLIRQLKDGGRLVIPVGPVGAYQTLWLVTREGGEVEFHNKGLVTFVPLTGER